MLKQHDIEYSRTALRWYADLLPWCDLVAGVKLALAELKEKKP